MAYDPNDPNSTLGPGIGSDARFPLTGWTTSAPPTGFASGGGGIGGDWWFPSQNADLRTLPVPAMRSRVMRNPVSTPTTIDPNSLDFSVLDMDPRSDPTGLSGPTPTSGGNTGNPFLSFLASLFNRGVGGGVNPQGMTGLLARGQGAPGTNNLGNPFNRFG
jgi:hypothetical protein